MSDSIISTVASLISGSLAFLLDAALLGVALTIVRKRRADAGVMISASAGVQIVITVAIPIVYALMSSVAMSSYRTMSAFIQLGTAFVHAIAAVLLILGLIKVAEGEPNQRSPY